MKKTIFEPIGIISSRFVYLAQENIDTDQILPAQFLTTTTRNGLGGNLFYHWRFDNNGEAMGAALFNQPDTRNSKILVAGRNFGCGSSREHAPWALYDYGFRVVLSPKLGDIFRSNCLKNGILAVDITEQIFDLLIEAQGQCIKIDLLEQKIRIGAHEALGFAIDDFSRLCLIKGADQMGFILSNAQAIDAYESRF